jgi:hypothetical protein
MRKYVAKKTDSLAGKTVEFKVGGKFKTFLEDVLLSPKGREEAELEIARLVFNHESVIVDMKFGLIHRETPEKE